MRLLIFAAALMAAPVAAQDIEPMPEPEEEYASMSMEELGKAWSGLRDGAPTCATRLPIMRRYAELLQERPEIGTEVIRLEMWCDYERDDYVNALDRLKALEASGGSTNTNVSLLIASGANDGEELVSRMRTAALDGDESSYGELDVDLWWFVALNAMDLGFEGELNALSAEVFRAGNLAAYPPGLQNGFVGGALEHGVVTGDDALFEEALSKLKNPASYSLLLSSRSYEHFWPQIEQRVGPAMSRVVEEHLASSRRIFAEDPSDLTLLNDLAHALYFAGEFEEILLLVDAQLGRDDLAETLVEDEGWTLNLQAYALDALGRRAEADKVFDFMAERAKEKGEWGVNFIINRASRLVGQKRWEEGLAAANEARLVSDDNGSIFAQMLVARDQLCALTALGRAEEAAEQLAFIRDNASEHPGLAAESLLCQDRDEEAVELLLSALADEDKRDGVISELQVQRTELFYTPSYLRKPVSLLESNAELKAEFEKFGRAIPEEFYTLASRKRFED